MKPRILTAGIFAAALTASGHADDFQDRIEQWQSETGVTGLAVAIWDGTQATVATAGLRSAEGERVQTDDQFAIASVTKTLTAAAVLQLAERGLFSLDDTVAEAAGIDFGTDVTVRDLLRHEAGMPEFIGGALSFGQFLEEHANGREAWKSAEILGFATAERATPDADFAYSNSHYALLGQIIRHQTGEDLASALRALVFEPAGLESAALVTSQSDTPAALGYSAMLAGPLGAAQFDARLARELASLGDAAGGGMINAGDLARWTALWCSGEFVAGQEFSPARGGVAFGLDAQQIQIGLGAFEVDYGGDRYCLHGGDGLGVTALSIYDPASGTAVAILQNDDSIRSLGFGQAGYLDTLALEILESRRD